jgi:hypothetical protein
MLCRSAGDAWLSMLLIGVPVAVSPVAHVQASPEQSANVTRWDWLTDTYWIVPKSHLPAVLFDPSTQRLAPVSDQTVYHITGYKDGYFWGKNVTQLGPGLVTCASLVGSVTPQGRILLSFTVVNTDGSVSEQQGLGEMVENRGQWTMENQTTAPNFAHWAYMVQSQPGNPSWNALPGVGISVTEFLLHCPRDGPQPVKPY